MPSPCTIDLATLLAPIPGAQPAGADLRYAGAYDAIRAARKADDNLDQGAWVRATKTADWAAVVALATEALATQSKDLQIAVWLVEALIQRHGFAGLRDGLQLVRTLHERFWETLYPAIEDNDLESRATPLEWLNHKLPPCIRQLPLTQGTNGEAYSWLRWDESRAVDNLGRRDAEALHHALADGKISGEHFDKAVATTPLAYYQTLDADLAQAGEACAQLEQVLDTHYGREAPSVLDLKQVVQDCHTLVREIVQQRGGLAPAGVVLRPGLPATSNGHATLPPGQPEDMSVAAEAMPVVAQPPVAGGTLEPHSRADALRCLTAVAAYFRHAEPHSPVSYLVQRAVRGADMPLEHWLQYVIHDESVLDSLRDTLGLKDTDRRDTEDDED
jgi:type VI secretion system protein ImpA